MKITKHELWRRVRLHCLECAGSSSAVRSCEITNCSLKPYRFGEIWAADRATFGANFDFSKKAMKKAIRNLCQYCLGQKYPKCGSLVCQLQPILARDVNVNVNPWGQTTEISWAKDAISKHKEYAGNYIDQSK